MGKDAAEISPRFVPDEKLLARDNSGGRGFEPYHAHWDDGGRVTGDKSHLKAGGGKGKSDKDD